MTISDVEKAHLMCTIDIALEAMKQFHFDIIRLEDDHDLLVLHNEQYNHFLSEMSHHIVIAKTSYQIGAGYDY